MGAASQVCTEGKDHTCCRKEWRKMNSAGLNVPSDSPRLQTCTLQLAMYYTSAQCVVWCPHPDPKQAKHINTFR